MEEKRGQRAPDERLKRGKVKLSGWDGTYGFRWMLEKRFFNKKTDQWEDSNYFFLDELIDLQMLLEEAISISQDRRRDVQTKENKVDTEW
jgi:hypothetical protein